MFVINTYLHTHFSSRWKQNAWCWPDRHAQGHNPRCAYTHLPHWCRSVRCGWNQSVQGLRVLQLSERHDTGYGQDQANAKTCYLGTDWMWGLRIGTLTSNSCTQCFWLDKEKLTAEINDWKIWVLGSSVEKMSSFKLSNWDPLTFVLWIKMESCTSGVEAVLFNSLTILKTLVSWLSPVKRNLIEVVSEFGH